VTPSQLSNLSAFVRALENELQLRGVEFSLCDLLAWATAAWPLAREEPDVSRWAALFLEARAAASADLGTARRMV
jgi:hypothetical protein